MIRRRLHRRAVESLQAFQEFDAQRAETFKGLRELQFDRSRAAIVGVLELERWRTVRLGRRHSSP